MKRLICGLLSVMLLISLCACNNKKYDDVGLIINLACTDNEREWIFEEGKKGIVDFRDILSGSGTDSDSSVVFLFDAAGQGETVLRFYYVLKGQDKSTASETKEYAVSVDAEYNITSRLMTDNDAVSTEAKIDEKSKAEKAVEAKFKEENPDNTNEVVVETEKEYEKDGKKLYDIRVSVVVINDDGTAVLRFVKMYTVDEDGNIIEAEDPENTEDVPMTIK